MPSLRGTNTQFSRGIGYSWLIRCLVLGPGTSYCSLQAALTCSSWLWSPGEYQPQGIGRALCTPAHPSLILSPPVLGAVRREVQRLVTLPLNLLGTLPQQGRYRPSPFSSQHKGSRAEQLLQQWRRVEETDVATQSSTGRGKDK